MKNQLLQKNEFLEKQLIMIKDIQNGDLTWQNLTDMRAEYYGERFHNDTTRRGGLLLKEYLEAGWIQRPTENILDASRKTISTSADGSQVSEGKFSIENENMLRDAEYLLKLHNYDPSKWVLVNSKNSFWDVQRKNNEIKTLYSSKVVVKPKKCDINPDEITKHFTEFSNIYSPNIIKPQQYEYGAECLVPCLFDVHFSKLAYYGETLNQYDYKIAKQRVIDSVKSYVNRFCGRKFECIYFAIGNDYFNSEANGETYNNTRQDNDSRFSKMFIKGVEALIEAIDIFSSIAPVRAFLVQGNHDLVSSFYASCVLNAWYRNSDIVTIDNTPTLRKYIKFGKNLLGFTHGSEEKDRIFGLMQHEAAKEWGESVVREWLVGHLHSESVVEKNGVVVRRVPSITGDDFWHYKAGYTMSRKRSAAYIYDKNGGLTETHYVNI